MLRGKTGMKESVKKYFKYVKFVWLPVLALMAGILGEIIYNLPIEKQNDFQYMAADQIEPQDFSLQEDGRYVSSGQKASLTIRFEKQYVDKFYYEYSYGDALECDIDIKEYISDDNIVNRTIHDSNNYILCSSTVNIRAVTDQITIRLPEDVPDVTIYNIALNNTRNYSFYRIGFVTLAAFFLLSLLLVLYKKIAVKLEVVFLVIIMSVGMLAIMAMPSHKVGFDEEIHFGRAYFFADTLAGKDEIAFPAGIKDLIYPSIRNWPYHLPQSEQEQKAENEYWNETINYMDKSGEGWETDGGYSLNLYTFSYIFQWLMLKLGMLLHLPFTIVYKMGRMGNLFLYSTVIYFAIRHLKTGKALMLATALMPTALMSSLTYTYDAWVNAFSMLGISYLLMEWMDRDRKISYKNVAIFTVAFVLASLPKPVYIPMIILACFFPKEKFRTKKESSIFRGAVFLVMLLMLSTFMLPAISNPQSMGGDARGGDTSVAGQLSNIFSHPLFYTKLLLKSISDTFFGFVFGSEGMSRMGHFMVIDRTVPAVILFMYTIMGATKRDYRKGLKVWEKGLAVFVSFGIMCLIWTALYLSYTPVGAGQINGVQGRYYFPVTILLFMAFRSKNLINDIPDHIHTVIVSGGSLFILLPVIYNTIIVQTF